MQRRTLAPKLVAGALILSLSISAAPDFRYTEAVHAGVAYSMESDFAFEAATGCVTAYKGSDQNINIPNTIEGTVVTEIGYEAFSGNAAMTDISMPVTIKSIGSMAFEGCSSLKNITIPERSEERRVGKEC